MKELLRSKIVPPRVPNATVARPHLIARLNEGLAASLILVSAPPGFGKSTLLACWVAQAGDSIYASWLSLDAGDNDAGRFLTYLAAAVEGAAPHLSVAVRALLRQRDADGADGRSDEEPFTALHNALAALDRRLVLVLDDYHVITDRAVHQWLAALLTHLPDTVTIVLATRIDPPLPLARLRAQNQVVPIRAADLRFSRAESARFLCLVMGLQLSETNVDVLAERTEGWITGLKLAALSMQQQDVQSFIHEFAGDNHNIRSYLVDEVLAGQPPEVQQFLMVTSILERLTAPLCDTVLWGNGVGSTPEAGAGPRQVNAQQILEYLEQHNLFVVPLDGHSQWYRYHTLFAELLRFHLWSEQRSRLPLLQQRAARWLEEHGFVDEALRQALAAGDGALAEGIRARAGQSAGRGSVGSWLQWFRRQTRSALRHKASHAVPPSNGHAFARGEYGRLNEFNFAPELSPMTGTYAVVPGGASSERVLEPLSEREEEVLALLADGLSYQEIGERLVISLPTVKSHVNHIYSKLGVHSRDHAIEQASQSGILRRR